jgi:hypothetical protein
MPLCSKDDRVINITASPSIHEVYWVVYSASFVIVTTTFPTSNVPSTLGAPDTVTVLIRVGASLGSVSSAVLSWYLLLVPVLVVVLVMTLPVVTVVESFVVVVMVLVLVLVPRSL